MNIIKQLCYLRKNKPMKRILFTVTNDLSYDQRMERICTSLQTAGYEVTLIGRKKNNSIELQDKPYKQVRLNCYFEKGKLFYLEYNLRLLFYLLTNPAEIICAIDVDTLLPAAIASSIKKSILVYDSHELFTEVPELQGRGLIKKIWTSIEKYGVKRAWLCYTVSDSVAKALEQKYQKKFSVIRNVPLLEDSPKLKNSSSFILYQGALNEGRGLEALLDAMASLNINLKIAGEGDLSSELRQKVKDLRLEDKVEFLGYFSPSALKNITQQAFLGYNLLDKTSLSYYYSLSNKYFDYIHAEVPNLSNAFPEYSAINSKYNVGLLIKTSSKEIIVAVEKLLSDKLLYLTLVNNCKTAKQELCWQREEMDLIELYNNCF